MAFGKPINEELLVDFIKRCLALLQDSNVVVGGGVALSVYTEPRLTQDLDLFLLPENLVSVEKALLGGGFVKTVVYDFKSSKIHKFKSGDRVLDILVFDDNELNKFLFSSPKVGTVFGIETKVLSIEGLIISKLISWRPKDKIDLESLFEVDNIDFTVIKNWVNKLGISFGLSRFKTV